MCAVTAVSVTPGKYLSGLDPASDKQEHLAAYVMLAGLGVLSFRKKALRRAGGGRAGGARAGAGGGPESGAGGVRSSRETGGEYGGSGGRYGGRVSVCACLAGFQVLGRRRVRNPLPVSRKDVSDR